MKKNQFLTLSIFLFLFCLSIVSCFADSIKPLRLSRGDTVALIAPCSQINPDIVRYATERMHALGLKVWIPNDVNSKFGPYAGTCESRVQQINSAFKNPNIKAIIALIGGTGANELLDNIDYKLIKDNPKIIMGYSDITALLIAIHEHTGLITFHGPIAGLPWPEFTVNNVKNVLFDSKKIVFQNPRIKEDDLTQTLYRTTTINKGVATGEILGGNLTVLTTMMGSKHFPKNWKGKILFLEDTGEDVYKIDRMLSQLKNAGLLNNLSGFVLGTCTDCKSLTVGGFTLEQVIDRYIKPLHIPAFSGAMIGHQDKMFVVPEGSIVKIDADVGSISMLESAVK